MLVVFNIGGISNENKTILSLACVTYNREVLLLPEKWDTFWNVSVTKSSTFPSNPLFTYLSQD